MYGTIELKEDLSSYFTVPRYTTVLFDMEMYLDFKRTLYETGDPSVIDDLDSVEYLLKDLKPRQKEIAGLAGSDHKRKRIGHTLETSLSTIKREIRNIKDTFSRLLPDLYR